MVELFIGGFTYLFSELVKGKVYAFEPVKDLF
jgi:hypothetical protein